jgi:uncharacterized protein YjiS (DUF1127 family)
MTIKTKAASSIWQKAPMFFRITANIVAVPEKIAAAIVRNRMRAALNRLDDYLLKDMGISRSDIERISIGRGPQR